MKRLLTILCSFVLANGCAFGGPTVELEAPSKKSLLQNDSPLSGKEDRWNRFNDPNQFTGEFNRHLEDMPITGAMDGSPWPSTYWPTYEDAINHRWRYESGGYEMSPAEKYDIAFNGWTPPADFMSLRPFDRHSPVPGDDWDTDYYENLGPLATHVSTNMGNAKDRALAIAEDGAPEEWEVETWWGLCHAWVPAALLEDRPERTVTHNGVDFHVGDLEALLIAAYNRTPAQIIGQRCNDGNDDDNMVERDEHGRATADHCRDSNPGTLHVIVTNYLGRDKIGFAMDRTYDYEVWNQPVVGYEITKQDEISIEDANLLLNQTGDTYSFNEDAATLYEVDLSLHWVTESHASVTPSSTEDYTRTDYVSYILEVDIDGNVIGGEYFGESRNQHPDFLWNPSSLTRSSTPNLNIDDIRMLIEKSRQPAIPTGSNTSYVAQASGGDIPDNLPTGVSSIASISNASGRISAVSVDLDLSHTYIGDLRVVLSKDGIEIPLHNRTGGSADDIIDTFSVDGFEGLDPNGDWVLKVTDYASADVGSVNSWTITVTTDSGPVIVDPPVAPATRFEGTANLSIPDNDSAGVSSTATVAGVTEGMVTIDVDITHTWRGDLRVTVVHNSRIWTLFNHQGGDADDLVDSFTLDATGNAFEGDPSGIWTLTVTDSAGQDVGTLNTWSVNVQ